ncbi:MAG: SDR family NAD(P)-dependent oxidoreductase [Opitutales bacterium]
MSAAPTELRLDGKRALITGSTQGIGLALARGFARAGASVCLHGLGGGLNLERERQALQKEGVKIAFSSADLARSEDVKRLAKDAQRLLGGVDILVLNASAQVEKTIFEQADAEIDLQLAVNLRATAQLLRELLPPMKERGWGRVLAIGSIQEYRGSNRMPIYAATKGAQLTLIRTLARFHAHDGITFNSIAPGVVDTPRNESLMSEAPEKARAMSPMRRVAVPEEFVAPALLFCAEAGSYITGTSLPVDGGMSVR